ncbi:MAG: hydrolase 2, exosortase A system-associated [Rhodoferax sp.]|uniref:hydrolase 2, exosortase A system-associated n=1 Tax=Rhodoferax sp. TaxID=50421 RepID=UPI002728E21F|nr:hydrolase 2, exosortase A system-associated [Rhodoferax sp.]MDO8450896.1 hydrolase 2, exosortase A system-associated [Rhodoferax sp.]
MRPEAFFIPAESAETAGSGQRFCLFHPAQGEEIRGLVLYIHPFAEEMNKARRMAALQARTLAQAGYAVLQIDLLGCGDSSGDFGDATWEQWVNDVVRGCRWLRSKNDAQGVAADQIPLWLWGLRAGCLLAVDAARQMDEVCNFLFWQPPAAGKTLLQQFLRLKVAGDMMGGQSKGIMETMRQQLANGSPVEIAGYMISPGLAMGLEQAVLASPANQGQARRLEWFELSTREDASLNPVSAKTIAQWQEAGFAVSSHIAHGPAFWQTTEIEDAPALIAATTAALAAMSA